MSCDIRIAGEKAKFGQPEVGLGKAKELIFSARMIDAKSAINRGIETDIETGMIIEKDLFGL